MGRTRALADGVVLSRLDSSDLPTASADWHWLACLFHCGFSFGNGTAEGEAGARTGRSEERNGAWFQTLEFAPN